MTRQEAYDRIEEERANQERLWPRDDKNPKSVQYNWFAPHLLVLLEKADRIRSLWYESKTEELQKEFVKIGAIAVRALEEVDDLNVRLPYIWRRGTESPNDGPS